MRRWVVCVPVMIWAMLGCYHAVVDTGRAPNGVTVEKKWAHSFIAGLVPPGVVETAEKCPGGIAKVETQLSFLNQLASFLTLSIYSPMEIVVSCAGSSADMIPENSVVAGETRDSRTASLQNAVDLVLATEEPYYVRF